ncbi:lipopolysaccharide assembly LapA domain-containing protein [Dermabacter vaginalis]|uniref:DUF1049 domain-containing protein n=1 Tax=Dermabacter vaginalis TaxID=1630135 RepID=A0ABX6A5U0_9MICO|nr:lipopolysaccharide assembly protein LapA domain-containing protein [Dermabacter vaginalis]QEU12576.1 DUF1049 domain-containing protein [Dermabacter vaginalis]
MNSKEYDGFSDSFRDSKAEEVTRAHPAGSGVNSAGTASSSAQAAPEAPSFGGAGQASDPKSTPSAPAAQAKPATPSAAPTSQRPSHAQQAPKAAPSTAPQSDQHTAQPAPKSRMGVVWASLIVGALLLILLLVFVIQNNVSTQFEYFTWQFNLPLGVAMLLAAIAGALIMALAGSVRMIQMGWELRKFRRDQK